MGVTSTRFSWLTLFASTGTLICCALPIIFVSLGLGAVVASLTSTFPWLIWLSLHKSWIFLGSGFILFIAAWLIYGAKRHCPTDVHLAQLCQRSQRWNKRIFWGSVIIWSIGFFAAFLALPLRLWLGI